MESSQEEMKSLPDSVCRQKQKQKIMHSSKHRVFNIPEELMLEVIKRLPIKKVVQLKCLNKGFKETICSGRFAQEHQSVEKFVLHYSRSSSNSVILGRYTLYPYRCFSSNYINLEETGKGFLSACTMSRCGRLLIEYRHHDRLYYIFNPSTGAYKRIPPPPSSGKRIPPPPNSRSESNEVAVFRAGLVDDVLSSSSSFKLVVPALVYRDRGHDRGNVMLEFYIFESESNEKNEWRKAHACHSSLLPFSYDNFHPQPIYLNDRMHWRLGNKDVLVFDLITERPGIISKPYDQSAYAKYGFQKNLHGRYSWFGTADGQLAYVIPNGEEILIFGYDYEKKLWQKKHLIHVTLDPQGIARPVFWDGKTLIYLNKPEIYQYEIQRKTCKKIGELEDGIDIAGTFQPFGLTFARVPECKYLHEEAEDGDQEILTILAKLQSLLTG